MKFGVFYELQLPRPWHERSEYDLVQNALTQVELADKLGYDYAWEVEHHFLEEYSHSSAPEVYLAAASQRTKNIRIGHGIIQLPTNHPARVAERVSMLDLVSNGRVEFGFGEGSSVTELHPFERRFRDKRAVWEDAVRAIMPMFGPEVKEIDKLLGQTREKGLSLSPTKVYIKGGKIKCELAVARGKKLHDKREAERAKTAENEARTAIRANKARHQ